MPDSISSNKDHARELQAARVVVWLIAVERVGAVRCFAIGVHAATGSIACVARRVGINDRSRSVVAPVLHAVVDERVARGFILIVGEGRTVSHVESGLLRLKLVEPVAV